MIESHMMACTGCGACLQICPKSCITMQMDEEGFQYPFVDQEKCVHCGMCDKVCPIGVTDFFNLEERQYYGAVINEKEALQRSSSGGLFFAFAEYIVNHDGYVSGCIIENKKPIHILTDKIDDVKKMQGSKYVQSFIDHTYADIKKLLLNGKPVLFTGTPCQIAGLYSYLGEKPGNLITIDIVCHGVPNADFFSQCIAYYEKKFNFEIRDIKFRSKFDKTRWGDNYGLNLIGDQETRYIPAAKDIYYRSFMECDSFRTCCYDCEYARPERVGDISLGDFWGVEKFYPNIDSTKGISMISVNSLKGKILLEKLEDRITIFNTMFEVVSEGNVHLKAPSPITEKREKIYIKLKQIGYEKMQREMLRKNLLKNILSKQCKEKIKKLLQNRSI